MRAFARREAPDTYTDMSLYDRCITIGLPGSMMPMIYGNAYEITQSPGYVAIRYEMVHETRIIPLGDSARLPSNLDFLMGDARGRFEGDTLVVETTNIRPEAAYRNASENLEDHRALHACRREHAVVGGALRGSRNVVRAMGVRDAAEAQRRRGPVRVCVP